MRLVVLPNIGISQALNDADFQGYCEMIQMANKFYDDMYWYFVVPQMMEGTVPELKRTQYVFVPERIDFRFHEYIASREFAKQFRRVGGEYFTDGMVTSRFGYGFIWEPLINNPYRLYDRYTVVLAETVAQTEEGNFYGYYPENALHALGCAMNPVLFLNGRTRAASRALAARYLSPNLLGEMDQRSHAYGFSVDADYVKLLNTKNKKYDRFTLFFGARFNYVKNVGLIYRIYDKFYSSGRDIDIVITTPNDELTVQQFDFTKQYLRNCIRLFYPRCDQFRYLEEASQCHAFVVDVGYQFTLEMLALGVVGVVKRHTFSETLLPKEYPYWFTTVEEAYAHLAEIEADYPAALRKIEPYRRKILAENRTDAAVRLTLEFIRSHVDRTKQETRLQKFGIEPVKEALLEFDRPFRLDALIQVANKYMHTMKIKYDEVQRGDRLTPHDVRAIVESLGYVDQCNDPHPIYTREEWEK